MTIKFDLIHQLPTDKSVPTNLEIQFLDSISQQHQNEHAFLHDIILIFLLFSLFSTKYADNLVASVFPCFIDSHFIVFIKIITFSFIFFLLKPFITH
jgi:hypothetical protein